MGSVANSGVHDRPPSLHQLPIITGRWKGEKRHSIYEPIFDSKNHVLEGRWFRIWFHPIDLQLPFGNGRCSNQSNMAVPVPYSFARWNSIFVPVQTPLQQVGSTGLYSTDRDLGDLQRKTYMQLVQLSCFFFQAFFTPSKVADV